MAEGVNAVDNLGNIPINSEAVFLETIKRILIGLNDPNLEQKAQEAVAGPAGGSIEMLKNVFLRAFNPETLPDLANQLSKFLLANREVLSNLDDSWNFAVFAPVDDKTIAPATGTLYNTLDSSLKPSVESPIKKRNHLIKVFGNLLAKSFQGLKPEEGEALVNAGLLAFKHFLNQLKTENQSTKNKLKENVTTSVLALPTLMDLLRGLYPLELQPKVLKKIFEVNNKIGGFTPILKLRERLAKTARQELITRGLTPSAHIKSSELSLEQLKTIFQQIFPNSPFVVSVIGSKSDVAGSHLAIASDLVADTLYGLKMDFLHSLLGKKVAENGISLKDGIPFVTVSSGF